MLYVYQNRAQQIGPKGGRGWASMAGGLGQVVFLYFSVEGGAAYTQSLGSFFFVPGALLQGGFQGGFFLAVQAQRGRWGIVAQVPGQVPGTDVLTLG